MKEKYEINVTSIDKSWQIRFSIVNEDKWKTVWQWYKVSTFFPLTFNEIKNIVENYEWDHIHLIDLIKLEAKNKEWESDDLDIDDLDFSLFWENECQIIEDSYSEYLIIDSFWEKIDYSEHWLDKIIELISRKQETFFIKFFDKERKVFVWEIEKSNWNMISKLEIITWMYNVWFFLLKDIENKRFVWMNFLTWIQKDYWEQIEKFKDKYWFDLWEKIQDLSRWNTILDWYNWEYQITIKWLLKWKEIVFTFDSNHNEISVLEIEILI